MNCINKKQLNLRSKLVSQLKGLTNKNTHYKIMQLNRGNEDFGNTAICTKSLKKSKNNIIRVFKYKNS